MYICMYIQIHVVRGSMVRAHPISQIKWHLTKLIQAKTALEEMTNVRAALEEKTLLDLRGCYKETIDTHTYVHTYVPTYLSYPSIHTYVRTHVHTYMRVGRGESGEGREGGGGSGATVESSYAI